jgi:hypothetical protein
MGDEPRSKDDKKTLFDTPNAIEALTYAAALLFFRNDFGFGGNNGFTDFKRVLGADLPSERVASLLRATSSRVEAEASDTWRVTPPSHRFDLSIEADYIEEVARLHGYDALPVHMPTARLTMLPIPEGRRALSVLQQQLVQRGYREVINFAFTDSKLQSKIDPHSISVRVSNPIASDLDVMRTSLWPGLLHCLQTNLNRQVRRLRVWLPPHLDAYTVDGAWDLQDRYGLGYWDALIVSSAHQQGCRYLLTEALPHDQVLDAVRAINPFVLAPNELDTAE